MKLVSGLIVLSSILAVCMYMGYLTLYTAGTVAAAQNARRLPFVGEVVERRINAWLLGAVEKNTIDDVPYSVEGTPLTSTVLADSGMYTGTVEERTDCEQPQGEPVHGILTQEFHPGHSGVDLAVNVGTPVLATMCGRVVSVQRADAGYGYLLIVQNGPYQTYYAHNSQINVHVGDLVDRGTVLSLSGSTGNSTGPHVHYEVRINNVPIQP